MLPAGSQSISGLTVTGGSTAGGGSHGGVIPYQSPLGTPIQANLTKIPQQVSGPNRFDKC